MRQWLKIFPIFFLFGLLIYANSFRNGFLWDDYTILNSPDMSQTKFLLSQWDPYNVKYFKGYYRPLAHMVYAFCYGTFKSHFWMYHLLNLTLFAGLCSLIYLLMKTLTANVPFAFLAALLFLVHPLNGILVDNIVSSVLTLQIMFMMGAMVLLWKSLEHGYNRWFYGQSLFVAFLSLFWYDMGVMTPLYLAAVVFLFRTEPWKTKAVLLLPFFFISGCYILMKHLFLGGTPLSMGQVVRYVPPANYIATVFRLVSWYLIKLATLQGIVMQWATPFAHDLWSCLGAFCLLFVFGLALYRFRRDKAMEMAVIWILVGFSPILVLGFMDPWKGAIIEPHWFIFSLTGFCMLAAAACLWLMERRPWAGAALVFVVVSFCGSACRAYNEIWANGKTYALFWSRQVPHSKLVDSILADAYGREGQLAQAAKFYKMSDRDAFIDAGSCNNIGNIDAAQGRMKEAEKDFRLALAIDPHFASAYNNLGRLYALQGQEAKAKKYYNLALAYQPLMLEPRIGLAQIALKHSQYQKAIDLCLKNLDIKKDHIPTLEQLIEVYAKLNDVPSVAKYADLLVQAENDPDVLLSTCAILTVHRIFPVAQACYDKTLLLDPSSRNAYLDEGTLWMRMGQYGQAIQVWQRGSALYPSDVRFKKYILQAMALKTK